MRFLHRRGALWAERKEDKSQIFAGKSGNGNAKRTRKSGGHCMGGSGCACRTIKSTKEKGNMGC